MTKNVSKLWTVLVVVMVTDTWVELYWLLITYQQGSGFFHLLSVIDFIIYETVLEI